MLCFALSHPFPHLLCLSPLLQALVQLEQTAVVLGFVAHLVHLLGKFLIIPLQFPIKPVGSRSLIYDHFHEEQNLDIKE